MAFEVRKIEVARQQRDERLEPLRSFTPCVLIYVDSPDGDAKAAGFSGYDWASEYNQPQSAFRVINRRTKPLVGLHVKVGWSEKPPFRRQVLGLMDGIEDLPGYANIADEAAAAELENHAISHIWATDQAPGIDKVPIFDPAIQFAKLVAAGGLMVLVQPFVYQFGGVHRAFAGTSIDLTSHLPTAGNTRYVLVYTDAATGTVKARSGVQVPTGYAPGPTPPKLPDYGIAHGHVPLLATTTDIAQADIDSARYWLTPKWPENTLPNASAIGQILIAQNSATFTRAIPMTDEFGGIMTDENGHIMTVG